MNHPSREIKQKHHDQPMTIQFYLIDTIKSSDSSSRDVTGSLNPELQANHPSPLPNRERGYIAIAEKSK
jgi:hypothetical protein